MGIIPIHYKIIGVVLLSAGLVLFGWRQGSKSAQSDCNRERIELLSKAAEADRVNREKEREWSLKLQEAQNNAIEREKKLQADNAAALASSNSLRNTIDSLRSKLSRAPNETCTQTADTGLKLLDECSEKYREVAERADRHASDVRTLMGSWPANITPK